MLGVITFLNERFGDMVVDDRIHSNHVRTAGEPIQG